MTEENESWLPNLIGGVSIWKLAPDLNEEQFFDGRLLVPETEGSDSLPVRVDWDLTGMIPLPEARASHGAKVESAIKEYLACLERTAEVFERGGSGYDKYKAAFTVPALDADGGAHYFFDPADDKLKVINWGASPRKIRHEKHYLFGYQDFGALIRKEEEAAAARGPAVGGKRAGAAAAAIAEGETPKQADAKKKDEKKEEGDEEKTTVWGRPWWVWILYVAGLIFLIVVALAVFQECTGKSLLGGAGIASDAGVDAGDTAIYGHSADDGGPPATELHADAAVDADAGVIDAAAVGDAGPGGAGAEDAGAARRDGGAARGRDAGPGGGGARDRPPRRPDGRPIYGVHRDPSGAWRYWIDHHGSPVSLPHREYYHPEAMQWRIVAGTEKVYDFSGSGSVFRVFLRPDEDFDGVIVQWRDRAGNWHDH